MQFENKNLYVPYNSEDEEWGLYILDVGRMTTPVGAHYPVGSHPPDYIFNFNNGRVLQEYQVIYISEGRGEFESGESGKIQVNPGSVIFLFPGVWHRYRPLKKVGWRESWIGFNGNVAEQILNTSYFSMKFPVVDIGIHARINNIYDRVFSECQQQNPGYQHVAAGMLMELLGLIKMFRKTATLNNQYIQSQIYQSRRIIEERFREEIDPVQVAEEIGMGYSNFRKHFRQLTGFSPVQYVIHLRLRLSKELLYNTNLSIKEIATRTGFNSSYYYARIFRDKVGMSPRNFRMVVRGLS